MKVILNEDVKYLGEEGDIKDVAKGYARNYLFPRNLAVPCNSFTLAHFESRKEEIEQRKAVKRQNAAGLKEQLEALTLTIVMPAGPNGKLYGAVTNQTISDELQKLGFEIERKRIELPGLTFKSVGHYNATLKLYEAAVAVLPVVVEAQPEAEKTVEAKPEKRSHRRKEEAEAEPEASAEAQAEVGQEEVKAEEPAETQE
ncbi:50S ribosomal protein L9 [Treponema sp. OMZ 305]|uniref:50S ribosomal protein L9 n=1 Tax=Treponema TaxID=157 RepID=UPI001BAF7754|nr:MULTISPECIES: 50S ribosomal protein L9 [Treponema]QUY18135.1 50S ribosomal protein L9 [Treponema vincentii]UTC58081.1 50S ribosomal protein L9 [Treponema sp. OMZ 305]